MVQIAPCREAGQLDEQILPQRAADAAVAEGYHLLLRLDGRNEQVGVDIYFGHVVYDDGYAQPIAVVEEGLQD